MQTFKLDYVIIYELCHLIQANHSLRFYALQAGILPDWRGRKPQLNHTAVVWQ